MPTAYGSPIYRGHRPAADAACVARARAAGAIVLGKTVTTEFAAFTPGRTANPRHSGAYARRLVERLGGGRRRRHGAARARHPDGGVGDPPGGLLRLRRLQAELWPHKSRRHQAAAELLDTLGIFAGNVADAALFAGFLAERPALRHLVLPSPPPRFGLYHTPMWHEAEPATAAALDRAHRALERAGALVEELAIAPEHRGLTAAQDRIMLYEMAQALAYERLERGAELSPRLAQMLDAGLSVGSADYDACLVEAAVARAGLDRFFAGCDAVLAPAAPGEAPAGLGSTGDPVFNRMWTLLGVPCVTVPARWAESGLPTGVQLVGRIRDDARVMAAAAFLNAPSPSRHEKGRRAAAIAVAAAIAGCSSLEPYATFPRYPETDTHERGRASRSAMTHSSARLPWCSRRRNRNAPRTAWRPASIPICCCNTARCCCRRGRLSSAPEDQAIVYPAGGPVRRRLQDCPTAGRFVGWTAAVKGIFSETIDGAGWQPLASGK